MFNTLRQVLGPGALGRPRGIGWRGRWWEGRWGWGIHINPWLIHVNVWQKPLQCCKVISLQKIKVNEKKKRKSLSRVQLFASPWTIQSWNSPSQKTGGSSRGSSQPMDQTQVSYTTGRFFTIWATGEAGHLSISKYTLSVIYSAPRFGFIFQFWNLRHLLKQKSANALLEFLGAT